MKSSVFIRPYLFFGLLLILHLLLHLSVFQKDLVGFHVWRQTQTQNTILSFVDEDSNILNPRRNDRGSGDGLFRMEFPLSQWLTASVVKLVGNDVFVSRVMNFIFSFLSLIGFSLWVGLYVKRIWMIRISAFILSFTPVFYYYMVNPLPDNLALCFGIWGLYVFGKWVKSNQIKDFVISLSLIALASLVKLPFILYFSVFAWVLLFSNGKLTRGQKIKNFILIPGFLMPVFAWYLWVIPGWEGNGIVQGIFNMTPDQKSQYWYYVMFHLRTSLPELMLGWPIVLFFVIGIIYAFRNLKIIFRFYGYYAFLGIILCVFFLFEMNMIEKVHDYYLIPILPLLVLLTVVGLNQIAKTNWNIILKYSLIGTILISLPVYSFFRIQGRWDRIGFNEDFLKYKMELRSAVPNDALVCVGNDNSHHIFLYYVQKMGWAFEKNWITAQKLREMIKEGCRYLYCDSRAIDQNPEIQELFGTKVAEYGSVRVYELVRPEELSH